jgi:hypothetical protein
MKITPYLSFNGNCAEATNLHKMLIIIYKGGIEAFFFHVPYLKPPPLGGQL